MTLMLKLAQNQGARAELQGYRQGIDTRIANLDKLIETLEGEVGEAIQEVNSKGPKLVTAPAGAGGGS